MQKKMSKKIIDVIIVGGGIIGLSIARELGRRGANVTLIERTRLGTESSFVAAGMLAPQAEADNDDAFFRLAVSSRDLYPIYSDTLFEETGIDIELDRTGTLYLAFTNEDEEELEERYQWQKQAGLNIEKLTASETFRLEPRVSPTVRWSLRFPSDIQVENRRLIAALIAAAQKYKVELLTGTEVISVRVERGRARGVETSKGYLSGNVVILAGGAWTSFLSISGSQVKPPCIEPIRGQLLCFESRPQVIRHVIYSPRGYVVPRRDGRLLVGTTTERVGFEKLVTGQGIHTIMTSGLEIAPVIGHLPFTDSSAGLRPLAEDGWPILGTHVGVQDLYLATGHYRNGILLTPITGELIADLILEQKVSTLLTEFSIERFNQTNVT
jgi:glycine oxidase